LAGPITNDVLMAYADGELAGPEAEAVEHALGANPEALAKVVTYVRSRRLARSAFRASGQRHDGDAGDGRSPAAPHGNRAARAPLPQRSLGLRSRLVAVGAAGIALGILAAAFLPLGRRFDQSAPLAVLLSPAFSAALGTVPSGEATTFDDARMRLLSSFHVKGDTLCREAELDAQERVHIIACRQDGAWKVRLIATQDARSDAFTPASGNEMFDDYLRRMEAGPSLSGTAEQDALTAARLR
jgi:hypothetical protein